MSIFRFTEEEVAIVTGGASGIGRALCELLAAEGVSVVSLQLPGQAVGTKWKVLECDVRDEETVSGCVREVVHQFGRLDMLANSAALVGLRVDAPLLEHSTALFREVMETNLVAQFVVLREVASSMRNAGTSGRIVNVASVRGVLGGERIAGYSASKAGLIGLTRASALELAPYGIRVNAVAPGSTLTETAIQQRDQQVPWRFGKEIPLGRGAAPEEVARVIAALLSSDSGFVTGACYMVDGGVSIY